MRRKSFLLLAMSLLLLLLPISKDNGFVIGIVDYSQDISSFLQLIFDPRFSNEPIEVKYLALLYIFQSLGWILYAVALLLLALLGLIRNSVLLKSAAVLSFLVLVHGVLEVTLSSLLTAVPLTDAIFTRFGLDLTDFMDDYDALFNSTLVPLGLIVWFFVSRRTKVAAETLDVLPESTQQSIENS